MVSRHHTSDHARQSVLVFGPQALALDAAALQQLHSIVLRLGRIEWLKGIISELTDSWTQFEAKFPKYKLELAESTLARLVQWSHNGILELDFSKIPNIIISPLVVIIHLFEYTISLGDVPPCSNGRTLMRHSTEALGFCTGLLSAFAVSLSPDHPIDTHGATAVRLAMIIGGIVDAQEQLHEDGPSRSLAAAWGPSVADEELRRILAYYPEAYVSVFFDERRATITSSRANIAPLQKDLREARIITNEIDLQGRFHTLWYNNDIGDIVSYFDSQANLSFPDASALMYPTRANSGGHLITAGSLHSHAVKAILVEKCDWYETVKSLYSLGAVDSTSVVRTFGPERCIPPSMTKIVDALSSSATLVCNKAQPAAETSRVDVAVIGMSIKVAGADDVAEFWKLLCEGQSQHKQVPSERMNFQTIWRTHDSERKWFGNFVNDVDAFDQKFFKKSAREAASMDPQQRHMLQAGYQALEQSGYFNRPDESRDKNVSCYIGVCAADYENNMACHEPNAFTATGNLKGFIAGKLSHHFGWTGPAMCIDTACSSSLVALDLACKSILSGECNTALAGGVNVITNPLWFQNLAGASFLSPTGQCKPFDETADGYCRGEGVAAVVLKRMSAAIANGDQILGVIPSTAVYQNQNCTPIFVPNSPSLSGLFRRVLSDSGLDASQIGYVEAHGTGTQVGDPAEYDSIRQVLGGVKRKQTLGLGSVKGLVGHTECSSGIVSLVKTILMIQNGAIPPQQSYSKANPNLNMLDEDEIEISTEGRKWDDNFRAALINNYGASGSNASMIVTQPPPMLPDAGPRSRLAVELPIRICGKDLRALKEYAGKLRCQLEVSGAAVDSVALADVAFNVCRKSNPSLEYSWIATSRSTSQLLEKLAALESGDINTGQIAQNASRPVILCFGGQVSTYVGLSRDVYDHVAVLRDWLTQCDDVCRSIGCESIFPQIFEKDPILDPVKLQTMLFSMQFSSAKSWMSCGIRPAAVVGHSFGELVSLCISGVLSLEDSMKMIAGRAKVIRDSWGPEKGSMIAIDAELEHAEGILAEANSLCKVAGEVAPTIACFNGPRSYTLAGSSKSIDIAIHAITQTPKYSMTKFKRLSITNAFHSTLVDQLLPQLNHVGKELVFNEPTLDIERSTEFQSSNDFSSSYVADHMRNPVYFSHAVQRLSRKYPTAVWLEAGSNSTIVNMAARASGSPHGQYFQPVNIANDNGLQFLTNATIGLWTEGILDLTFWMHHRKQTYEYAPLILPAYQFEKTRHWMNSEAPPTQQTSWVGTESEACTGLWSFVGFTDSEQRSARFNIHTTTKEYMNFVSGHIIAQEAAICPATLQIDIVVEALISICPEFETRKLQPKIHRVENHSPLCVDPSRKVWMEANATDADKDRLNWNWKIISEGRVAGKPATTTHVTGSATLLLVEDDQWRLEFSRYERLVGHSRCVELLGDDDADDVIQGRQIYRAFSEVVDYSEDYRGLRKLVGRGTESAGKVVKRYSGDTWLDAHLSDCFSQVGGIWVNCMADKSPDDMYIATGFEKWMRTPDWNRAEYTDIQGWDVFSKHVADSEDSWLSDIFIFNPSSGRLVEVILGVKYHRVSKISMRKILVRLTPGRSEKYPTHTVTDASPNNSTQTRIPLPLHQTGKRETCESSLNDRRKEDTDISDKIRNLLAEISGLEAAAIRDDSELADIGIDSLMGMELARELEGLFKCSLASDELVAIVNFKQLIALVHETLGVETIEVDTIGSYEHTTEGFSSSEGNMSPTPPQTAPSTLQTTFTESIDQAKPAGHATPTDLSPSSIISAFEECKKQTDRFITDYGCAGYMDEVLPRQTQLCISLTLEAFEQLGCSLASAKTGQDLNRIQHVPQQKLLTDYLYQMLEREARIIDLDGGQITRTAVKIPYKSSDVVLASLLEEFPNHIWANRLTYFAGRRLADVLSGKRDGIKLIFGSGEGRELVSGLYGDSLLNKLANVQMQDIVKRLVAKIPPGQGPLKIMELGAGTGGTTKGMVSLLSNLGVPVEYTFTDLSGSFVAAARNTFKQYPFMRYRVHNIENPPTGDLVGSQHIVIASNAVHATHNLVQSLTNIHKALRPDGFLIMLEMTQPVWWVDMIFGLFEGWWLFDDGRNHAIAHQSIWERDLQRSGFGHVDWTDGHLQETEIQRVIIALATGPRYDRQPLEPAIPAPKPELASTTARKATMDEYISKHTRDFLAPHISKESEAAMTLGQTVLITGASGSLGTHLVAHIAALPQVTSVICLNRRSTTKGDVRQQQAMEERGIILDAASHAKLQVIQTDTSKPLLGLSSSDYESLARGITHILHNAWPMSGKRALSAMESQFHVMRNLIDLAREAASTGRRPAGAKVGFQLVSSIAVVGHHPVSPRDRLVPEERVGVSSVLPNGYGEAKFVCERMLDETLHRHGAAFRPMTVRLGQVAGSRASGYWNPVEHLPFLLKSSQTLRALPAFEGDLCWTPVEDVAGTLADLLLSDRDPRPVYHIDNPVRQPWSEMLPVLAEALNIPPGNMVPFKQWVRRVRSFPGSVDGDNPAAKLVDFLDDNFVRMSCGGLLLDAKNSCEHSPTLAAVGPVSPSVVKKFVQAWKDKGFLN